MAKHSKVELATKWALSYGTWPSPITAEFITRGTKRYENIVVDGTDVYWNELHPTEAGRYVVLKRPLNGSNHEITPLGFSVRSRVHEYGGGAFTVHKGILYFVNDKDQKIYNQTSNTLPKALTSGDCRFADLIPSPHGLLAVGEIHKSAEHVENFVSLIDYETGFFKPLLSGEDFYSSASFSPDGKKLAWLSWNHPNMPWDENALWMGDFVEGTIQNIKKVAGDKKVSIFQPQWSPKNELYFVSDQSGWWNLYRQTAQGPECLLPMEAEFGLPQWSFGMSTWDFAGERILCTYSKKGMGYLAFLDPETHQLQPLNIRGTEYSQIRTGNGIAAFIQGFPTESKAIVCLDLQTLHTKKLTQDEKIDFSTRFFSLPEPIEFPSANGRTAYGFYYPPQSKDYIAPKGEKPPLIVKSHGGPTAFASGSFDFKIQYWTSRGFAVLDVNYGGSSGYGRAYRELLKGKWGIVDMEDCEYGAQYLVKQKKVDPRRLAITGGSAGGYTTLCALTFGKTFTVGASYYGVSDLYALVRDTHKFESHYLEGLIGPYPEKADIYKQRSPIYHVKRLKKPVIFFQGLEDKVVPPNQAESMYNALQKGHIPTKLILYEGEQHGLRRAENMKDALEKEIEFYLWVFQTLS